MTKNFAVQICPWCGESYEGVQCDCLALPIIDDRGGDDRLPQFVFDEAQEPA